MATVNFYLDKSSKKNQCYISMYFRYGKTLTYSTGEQVEEKYWNKKKQEVKKSKNVPDYEQINTYLNDLKKFTLETYNELKRNEKLINNGILREKIKIKFEPNLEYETKENFICAFEKITNQITKSIKTKSTVRKYTKTLEYMTVFCKTQKKTLKVVDVDSDFLSDFELFLAKTIKPKRRTHKKPSNIVINQYMSRIRSLITKLLRQEGVIRDLVYKSRKTYTTKIYLNEEELDKIYKVVITKEQLQNDAIYLKENKISAKNIKEFKIIADTFVANAFVGLRFSDMQALDIANFDLTTTTIITYNKKTSKDVYIPMKPIVLEILKKYDFELPKRNYKHTIKYIQYIAKVVGITDVIKKVTFQDNERIIYEIPKYELIGTHTARRSFATNAYLAGMPILLIMSITGHTKVEMLMRYICVGNREQAEQAANHPFFQ